MGKRVTVNIEGREYIVEVGDLNETPIKATVNQNTYLVEIQKDAASAPVGDQEEPSSLPAEVTNRQAITAPMPGDILEIRVKSGDLVNEGDVLCVLEAMKMKNLIHTTHAGKIAAVEVVVGQSVDYGAVLVSFE
ncbi:MAG: biotin/lipoyl-containing protein [Candidatus Promineifilaceae bacterium]|jgi:biotin carboxyl carrier protein